MFWRVSCLHVMSDCIQCFFKNGGHQRRKRRAGWDRAEREKASSHLGDIRSVLCEQSRPTGEQSWSLELGYYRLVGPCVWKCTCRRAGLWLWRLTVGGGGFFGLPVCQLSVCLRPAFLSGSFLTLFLRVFARCEHIYHTHSSFLSSFTSPSPLSSDLLFPFSFSPLTTIITLHPPHTSSFTPPLHPSNVGGQLNNIQGVTATGSPLPAAFSCYCPRTHCCLAPHTLSIAHTPA